MNLFSRLFHANPVQQLEPGGVQSQKSAYFLLDVRQPEEYREGHIAGAKLIPLDQLGRRMKELPRERQIVCVCRSGSRSGAAARDLAAAGYQAANLRGGMLAWAREGLPVKKGSA
jgi:rhodanese-related sulfurtransferase